MKLNFIKTKGFVAKKLRGGALVLAVIALSYIGFEKGWFAGDFSNQTANLDCYSNSNSVSDFPWQNYPTTYPLIDWEKPDSRTSTAIGSNVYLQVQGIGLPGNVNLIITKNLRVSGSYGTINTAFVFEKGYISIGAGQLGATIGKLYLTEGTRLTGNLQRIEKFYYVSESDLVRMAAVAAGLLPATCNPSPPPTPTNMPRGLNCNTRGSYPFPRSRYSETLLPNQSVNKIEANSVTLSGDGYAYIVVANNLTLKGDAGVQKAYVFNRLTLSDTSDVTELRGSGATIVSPPGTRVYQTYNTISKPRLKTLAMIATGRLARACENY